MKKILITGANGYIGKCLYYFLKKKFKVIGIDKEKSQEKNIIQCNILHKNKLDKVIKREKPEIIVHLAAQSLVDETINKKKYYDNNDKATKSLLEIIKKNKIKKIIFSSTAAIYKQSSKPLKENSKIKSLSTYAKTKLMCEKKIQNEKNLKFIILRFFNVCSALDRPVIGEFHNPETHLIPTIVYKAMHNKKIFIYGENFNTFDGTCIRDYIHIKDICSAFLAGLEAPSHGEIRLQGRVMNNVPPHERDTPMVWQSLALFLIGKNTLAYFHDYLIKFYLHRLF